jgi:PAS domain S-box-containing protein
MTAHSLTESLRETLSVFCDPDEPLATTEVAERLDLGRRSTYERLDRLVERGRLETKRVGASARVWWRPRAAAESTDDVGVLLFDEASAVAWANEAVGRYFGLDHDGLVGRDRQTLVTEVLAPTVREEERFGREALDGVDGDRFTFHVRQESAPEDRWLERRREPIDDGLLAGGHAEFYYDLTARETSRPSEEDDESHGRFEQFEQLVDAVDEYAIFKLDEEGYVETWNDGAERIKGYHASEVVGEHFSTFYTESDCDAGVPQQNLRVAAEDGSFESNGWRVRKDGSRFWARVTVSAVRDDDGTLDGFLKVTRDMTDRREREQQYRQERNLLRRILDTAPVGIGVFDGEGDAVRLNGRFTELLGLSDESDGYQLGRQPIRDPDGEVIPFEDRPAPLALRTGEPVIDSRVRVDGNDGQTRWLSVNAVPFGEEPRRAVVTMADVTQLREQADRLERQRDDLESELRVVFDRVDDGFFALDEQWQFTHVNDHAADLLGRSSAELVGRSVWDAFPEGLETSFQTEYERAMETQETTHFEEYFEPLDTWFEVSAYPSESGLSVYFRDVTEQKERERELERYETIVETVEEGIYVVDEDGYFTQVNRGYEAMVGRDRAELVGSHVSVVGVDEQLREQVQRLEAELIAGRRETATLEAELPRPDGGTWTGEATFSLVERGDGYERVGVVRDVTERKQREQELELYETVVETVEDGIYAVDADAEFVMVNQGFCELTGYDRTELLGRHATTIHDEAVTERAESMASEVAEGDRRVATIELDVHRRDGESVPCESRLAPFSLNGETGRCGVVRDVSTRLEQERELQKRVHQQGTVAELGQQALEGTDLDALMHDAAALVADALGADYCKMLDLDEEREELLLRQGVGWQDGLVGSATVSAVEDESQASYTLQSQDPVVVEDLETETRFSGPVLLTDHDVRSGISVVVGSLDDPWGILGVHDTETRSFTETDVDFVQSVANVLASAIDRHAYETRLVRQREQLKALNDVNRVVNEITVAVIEQSTREEIEATVCERLAQTESYRFAWVGEVDVASKTVSLRAEAGVENYLADLDLSVDPDEPGGRGPTARAFRTSEIQVVQDVTVDPEYEQWRDHAERYGYRSSAAVPIVHDGTLYGVLNIYAGRPYAFEDEERSVLERLGRMVGHAIAAMERKHALMSDELVQLQFRIPDLFGTLGIDEEFAGTVSLEQVIPLSDDEYVVYGHTTPDATEVAQLIVDTVPHWTSVTFLDEPDGRDRIRFELRLSEPPVLSAVAAAGGSVESAVIEDGDYEMTIHLSPTTDAKRIIELVREEYPAVRLLRRTQVTRETDSSTRLQEVLTESLTERQRTALEMAYHAGFFEWPRRVSGEEVAETMDISPPTFHQHLRKAERKILDSLFASAVPSAS